MPVFTMSGGAQLSPMTFPAFYDEATVSSSSSMSNVNLSPSHNMPEHTAQSRNGSESRDVIPASTLFLGSDNASMNHQSFNLATPFSTFNADDSNYFNQSQLSTSANQKVSASSSFFSHSQDHSGSLFQSPGHDYPVNTTEQDHPKSPSLSASTHSESIDSNPSSATVSTSYNSEGINQNPNLVSFDHRSTGLSPFDGLNFSGTGETNSTNPDLIPSANFSATNHFENSGNISNVAVPINPQSANADSTISRDEVSALKSELDDYKRSKDELEKQLLVQAASIKQYDVYCQSLASELTTCQATLEKERRDSRSLLESESGSLRSQLQSHADSIKILVSEKSDFEATLKKLNAELANKNAELTKLRDSTQNEAEWKQRKEEEQTQMKANMEEKFSGIIQELETSKQTIEDLNQEVSELRSKISSRDKINESLTSELKLKSSKLEMAELNLAQLRTVKDADDVRRDEQTKLAEKESELSRLTSENEEHVRRVSELTAYIQQASVDREQIIHQYTSYSQQLASQIELLTQQLNERAKETHHLATREKDLVQHVQQLEAQLQKLIQAESSPKPKSDVVEVTHLRQQILHLDSKLLELQEDRDKLQDFVQSQNAKISDLTESLAVKNETLTEMETQLEMLRTNASADVSQMDLMAACQSDKVAASRAMVQNKQLKDQLDELQYAIVQVTNSKAEIVSELDSVLSMRARQEKEENALRMEISGLHASIAERDRSINHMREQMKYYIAFAENSISGNLESGPRDPGGDKEHMKKLISELQNAKEEIRSLNSHNSELRSQLEVLSSRTRDSSGTPDLRDDSAETPPLQASMSDSPRPPGSPTPSASSTLSSTSSSATPNSVTPISQHEIEHSETGILPHAVANNEMQKSSPLHRQSDSIPPMSQDVALLKLEQKFKQAMSRIAELVSEKEHLEHVIVQLQEETDTVGEYITIYQYQRQQQRKRLEENERQLQIVSRDKEDLKSKLSQLQNLVTSFVQDAPGKTETKNRLVNGGNHNGQIESAEDALLSPAVQRLDRKSSSAKKTITTVDLIEPLVPVVLEAESAQSTPTHHPPSPTKADKILALISEIGANQMLTNMEDFQPWFWEPSPGKLINI